MHELLNTKEARLAQFATDPGKGPSILFFSGGTALREACAELIHYTHNSIHIVTPFDSGGSSAVLRQAFSMPAVGDARNRLLALADYDNPTTCAAANLFGLRLAQGENRVLREEVVSMAEGSHKAMQGLAPSVAQSVKDCLHEFLALCPESFDFQNASVGNLILSALYLRYERSSAQAIDEFGALVGAKGMVRLVLDEPLHLMAEYADGRTVIGQHKITGKEVDPVKARIERLRFVRGTQHVPRSEVRIANEVRTLISHADLICYPVGSFYSSIVANLLPAGVADSIAANQCPKIYVPNLGLDPELHDTSLSGQVETLLSFLRHGAIVRAGGTYLDAILVDGGKVHYPGGIDDAHFEALGLKVVRTSLLDSERGLADPVGLIRALLALSC